VNALEQFSAGLLDDHRVTPRPAINVDLLAHRLKVRVREKRLPPGDRGYTAVIDGQVYAVLDARMALGRRRFVLAHELGHVLCADPRSGATALRQGLALDEERFCDRMAEALLLPGEWLRKRYARSPQSLPALLECSRQAKVSPASASIGLMRGAGWNRTLLRLRHHGSDWQLLSVTGELPVSAAALRIPDALSALLDDGAASGLRNTKLPLAVRGRLTYVLGDAMVQGNIAMILADLSPLRAAKSGS
jgi:hypothetical protein